ncbi:glycosyltransferase family 2 protein [Volucribacter amazonae]|uniref:Glycosyl transferase family 2 n=1 Tax=Volucribacter amazonae TaxID=256731 RepID=A0A9X4PNG7_9PAST|nr:glycosyltransferase [Volucribacter amazonae]MDG6894998.1 glycosyl transferase family 2 [Volucribacter amazonae]
MNETTQSKVTLVITSAGRFDLLAQTLQSFFHYNHYPLAKIIIIEDSGGGEKALRELLRQYTQYPIQLIINPQRLGQMRSIDRAYAEVTTPYIFHCEDDWLFSQSGFIKRSLAVLEQDPKVLLVGMRSKQDYPEDFFLAEDYISPQGEHFYQVRKEVFTFNPTLRRKADMDLFGHYAKLNGQPLEDVLSDFYRQRNFISVFFKQPVIEHLGDKRRVHFSQNKTNNRLNLILDQWIKKAKVKLFKFLGKTIK